MGGNGMCLFFCRQAGGNLTTYRLPAEQGNRGPTACPYQITTQMLRSMQHKASATVNEIKM
jgi:hypothetical protein